VALFKPQFEVGRSEVGKKGVVRDPAAIEAAIARFREWSGANDYVVKDEAPSEVAGAEGNREIFIHLEPTAG
jgi:23S rRNA (cytidine1920-2'-O)/16S rRNA (cytidine1409-2'-O)-methyltransferase